MNGQNENMGGTFDIFGDTAPDLGSTPTLDPFAGGNALGNMPTADPFAADSNSIPAVTGNMPVADPFAGKQTAVPTGNTVPVEIAASPTSAAPVQPVLQVAAQSVSQPTTGSTVHNQESEPENLLFAAVQQAEAKQAVVTAEALFSKSPIFVYAAATEEVKDGTITFEQLRILKASDFPELEDSKRVSWSMEYCGIIKQVSTPAKTVISHLKTEIENSKEFLEALKKSKDKNPDCKIKPKITAQSKGVASRDGLAGYKGVFTTMEEADASDKLIRILPARDGHVYEIRCTEAGKFIARTGDVQGLSEISAGFVPALPPIPFPLFSQVLAFFYHFMQESHSEVMVYIYWDKEQRKYCVRVPIQTVGQAHIYVVIPPDETIDEDRYIHVADIHSHNSMPAFFSKTDDRDELATRIYMVVGKLHDSPEICARISVGGRFVPIDVREVMNVETGYMHSDTEYDKRMSSFLCSIIRQPMNLPQNWQNFGFPEEWKDAVSARGGVWNHTPFQLTEKPSRIRRFQFWRIRKDA